MNELYHHGILGQRWGFRRYQNPDGSLTDKGRKHYLNEDGTVNKKGLKLISKIEKKERKNNKYSSRTNPDFENKLKSNSNKSLENNNPKKEIHPTAKDTYSKVRKMNDEELKKAVDRFRNEDSLREYAKKESVKKGESIVKNILVKSGTSALEVLATGAFIKAGEKLTEKMYGKEVAESVIKYGREPKKK